MVVCRIGAFSWSYWTLSAVYSVFHLDSPSLQHSLEKSFKAINWGNCRVHLTIFQLSLPFIPWCPVTWKQLFYIFYSLLFNETKAHYFHTHIKIWNSIETHLFEAYIICFNHFQGSSFLPIWCQRLSPPFL